MAEQQKQPAVGLGSAQKLAEQGFVTMSLDLSFWGESEGKPRNAVLPDMYAEDFSAAVDYLGTRPFVDRQRIGVRARQRADVLRSARGNGIALRILCYFIIS